MGQGRLRMTILLHVALFYFAYNATGVAIQAVRLHRIRSKAVS